MGKPKVLYIHNEDTLVSFINKFLIPRLKEIAELRAILYSENLEIPPQIDLVISGGLKGRCNELSDKIYDDQTWVVHSNDPHLEVPKLSNYFKKSYDFLKDVNTIIKKYSNHEFSNLEELRKKCGK